MNNLNLDVVMPKLKEALEKVYTATEKGSLMATSKGYHTPLVSDYLSIVNLLMDLLVPEDVALCPITGRVHAKWYFEHYTLFVEPIPGGEMYNISVIADGVCSSPTSTSEVVNAYDLSVILLLHALSSKVSLDKLSLTVGEISKVRDVVCKKPLVKASQLPRP